MVVVVWAVVPHNYGWEGVVRLLLFFFWRKIGEEEETNWNGYKEEMKNGKKKKIQMQKEKEEKSTF